MIAAAIDDGLVSFQARCLACEHVELEILDDNADAVIVHRWLFPMPSDCVDPCLVCEST